MTGLREAGAAIANAGLTDTVTRAREADITTRRPDSDRNRADRETPERRALSRDDAPDDILDDDREGEDDDAEYSNRDDAPGDDGDTGGDADDADGTGDDTPAEALHTVKINGKPTQVPTSELIAGYQRQADYSQKTAKLSERARTLDAGHAKAAEVVTEHLKRSQALVARVYQDLVGDMNSQEMRDLRRTNFGEWQRIKAEYDDRTAQVATYFQTLNTELERHDAAVKEQRQSHLNTTLTQEREKVLAAIPDWDEGADGSQPGSAKLVQYLVNSGFSSAELDGLTDSRHIVIADKARRYDEMMARQKKAPAKAVPKHIPAGGGQVAKKSTAPSRREYEAVRSRAAKSGDMRDAGAAISKLLKL
jgi:hypothetical protein